MSYGRVEINLLPPELQPGPVVRYALLINFTLIAAVLTFIVLDSFLNFSTLAGLRKEIKDLNQQIAERAQVEADYSDLTSIRDTIQKYGLMVGLASAKYADIPVVLERVSRLLPDGVYLANVVNDRAPAAQTTTNVTVTLYAARPDTRLIQQTLVAFKRDPIMFNCHLKGASYDPQALDEYLKQIGVNWSTSGGGYDTGLSSEEYSFEINVKIDEPLSLGGMPVTYDVSRYFTEFLIQPPVEAPPNENATGVQKGAAAIKQGSTISQGMATVDVGEEGE